MYRKSKIIIFITFILTFSVLASTMQIHAQNNSPPKNKNPQDYLLDPKLDDTQKRTPVPYDPAEFETWSYLLYRFFAVTVGSFPFSMLVSTIVFDAYKTGGRESENGTI